MKLITKDETPFVQFNGQITSYSEIVTFVMCQYFVTEVNNCVLHDRHDMIITLIFLQLRVFCL